MDLHQRTRTLKFQESTLHFLNPQITALDVYLLMRKASQFMPIATDSTKLFTSGGSLKRNIGVLSKKLRRMMNMRMSTKMKRKKKIRANNILLKKTMLGHLG